MWNQHKEFSPEFLDIHHDFVVYDVYHHIKALFLFPLNCSCGKACQCSEWRKKIILSLNTKIYNDASQLYYFESQERFYAMKALWYLPEDHLFRKLYTEGYPVWAIEKELKEREESGHFKTIDQLVWTFLRLGKTPKSSTGASKVSINEAKKIISRDLPVHTKAAELKKADRVGEKKYEDQFKHYKSVCHFIAAQVLWKKEEPNLELYFTESIYPPLDKIKRFLSLAHWFRKKLLSLERPNVKNKVFLLEEDLCPLPDWVQSNNIDLPIEPIEEKIKNKKSSYIPAAIH